MENRIIIPILCAAALAYACGPWRHSQNDTPVVVESHAAQHNQHSVATVFNVIPKGSSVDFALSVLNNTKKTVELKFPSGQTHDFVVLDSLGKTVWRWSDGRMFTQAMQSKAVKASDTLTIADRWNARGAHGTYVAVATLKTDDHIVKRSVTFTLP
jgi:hypothetical protein